MHEPKLPDFPNPPTMLTGLLALSLALPGPAVPVAPSDTLSAALARDVAVLAADSLGGRVSGSPGSARASAFIRDRFARLGLRPLQGLDDLTHEVPLKRNLPGEIWIRAGDRRLLAFRDVNFYGFREVPAGPRPLRYVGRASTAELEAVQPGDVVLTAPIAGGDPALFQRISATQAAALVFVMPAGMEMNRTMPEVADPDHDFGDHIPTFYLDETIAGEIWGDGYDDAAPGALREVELGVERQIGAFDAVNVVGRIEGGERPEETVVVMAHYDHLGRRGGEVYNGADDNASGTAGLLWLAERWARRAEAGEGPRRTLVFLALDAEEYGNLGAEAFVASGLLDLDRVAAAINLDGVGRWGSDADRGAPYVYGLGLDYGSEELGEWAREVAAEAAPFRLDLTFNAPPQLNLYYRRSDHWPFARSGVPSIFLFGGLNEDYHSPTDDAERIDVDLLRARVGFADALIARIDAEPEPPTRREG